MYLCETFQKLFVGNKSGKYMGKIKGERGRTGEGRKKLWNCTKIRPKLQ